MKSFVSILICALVLTLPLAAQAKKDDKVPTKITSKSMHYAQDGQQVVFEGDVHVSRPDLEIWSKTLTVYFAKGAAKSAAQVSAEQGKIDKIVARGNVRLKRDTKTGRCGRATYKVAPGVLIMEENPSLADGKNTISGRIIRLFLKDNRSEVEGGGNQQVEAIFFTPKSAE